MRRELRRRNVTWLVHRDDKLLEALRRLVRAERHAQADKLVREWIAKARGPEALALRHLEASNFLEMAGSDALAITHLSAGLALEPQGSEAAYFLRNNMGVLLTRRGRYVEAERFCRAALRVDRLRVHALETLAFALAGQERPAEAALYLLQACAAAPEDRNVWRYLEELYVEHGEAIRRGCPDIEQLLGALRTRFRAARELPNQDARVTLPLRREPRTLRALAHLERARAKYAANSFRHALADAQLGLAWDSPELAVRGQLLLLKGLALVKRDSLEAGLPTLREAADIHACDPAFWIPLARIELAAGHAVDAALAVWNAMRLDGAAREPHRLYSLAVRRHGKTIHAALPDLRGKVRGFRRSLRERAKEEQRLASADWRKATW